MRIKPQQNQKAEDDNKPKVNHHKHSPDSGKEFKLAKKEQEEAGAQLQQQQQSTSIKGEAVAGQVKSEGIQASTQVNNVREAILKMVDSMRIGQMEGKTLLNAQLKSDASIHSSLRGAEVRLEMTEEGLKVHIEPIAGQKDIAQSLIAQHNDAIAQLRENLAAKNINLQHLQVGDLVVDLPQDKPLTPNELFSGKQMDQGSREGKKGDEPPERIDPTEKS